MGIAAIVSQDVQVGNAAGSGVANAVARGADTVSVACFINVLAYELVVLDSVKSAEDLKGKSIGISRFGSVSDVAARELIRGLGLRPMEDVKILQVGGAAERAAGFSRGVIAGFPSPPGNVNLIPGGLPHPNPSRHGRSSQTVPLAVYLCSDHQELSRQETTDREENRNGAD